MVVSLRRSSLSLSLRAASTLRRIFFALLLLTAPAYAVIVRGIVTDPLGKPIPYARVQLVQGKQVAAFTISGPDGAWEIRSSAPGRFLLLTSALGYTPNIGTDFYGGRTAVITRNVVMEIASITTDLLVTSTGLPTPAQQLSSAITLLPQSAFSTQFAIVNDLRQAPGSFVLQTGQTGGPVSLFIRGGSPDANKVLIDGVPSTDLGGSFDFSPISTTGLAGIELHRGPNSALYGTGAEASVAALTTSRGDTLRPVLNYSGDGGNFHTYRNEVALSGTRKKLDYYTAFSRFDTSNALRSDEYHAANSIANLGYSILSNTQARFTLRDTVAATGLPGPHDFYDLSALAKQSDQDLYSGFTLENVFAGWHNLARYGIARKREQIVQFAPANTLVAVPAGGLQLLDYLGNPVTIRGANGYTASGQAILPNNLNADTVSNRDEFYFQSDYTFPYRIAVLFTFHYENERGSLAQQEPAYNLFSSAPVSNAIQRTNYLYTLQVQGDIKHRLFYSLGGAVEDNGLFGIAGTPRLGLAWAPVRPGRRIFRGTRLRASFANGVQEPSLDAQLNSLYTVLNELGYQNLISQYHVTPASQQLSRTWDFGIDQSILNQKLLFKAGYFHNQFDHQLETLSPLGLEQYFGLTQPFAPRNFGGTLNSLAYRAQGMELEVRYQPFPHLSLNGGYTYLASLVENSFSADAAAARNGTPFTNPRLPGIAIGALSPLVGSRPFNRPPHTGYFAVQYASNRFSAAIKGALASRSDDSTFLLDSDSRFGNTLLLPNRNLDFGYAKLDANLLFAASHHVYVFTQLDNLLGQQHIGPIGYPGLPFTIRAGLKIRIGGN